MKETKSPKQQQAAYEQYQRDLKTGDYVEFWSDFREGHDQRAVHRYEELMVFVDGQPVPLATLADVLTRKQEEDPDKPFFANSLPRTDCRLPWKSRSQLWVKPAVRSWDGVDLYGVRNTGLCTIDFAATEYLAIERDLIVRRLKYLDNVVMAATGHGSASMSVIAYIGQYYDRASYVSRWQAMREVIGERLDMRLNPKAYPNYDGTCLMRHAPALIGYFNEEPLSDWASFASRHCPGYQNTRVSGVACISCEPDAL